MRWFGHISWLQYTNGSKSMMSNFHQTSRALPTFCQFLWHTTHKVCCVRS